jgi:hypothetical protein
MDWQEIGKWVAGVVTAFVGGGLVFRFVFVKKSNISERTVIQKNNHAGRDIVGGDKIDRR